MTKQILSFPRFLFISLSLAIFASISFATENALAAGEVSVCDETNFDAALAGGGLVTFSCDGTIPITLAKNISANTTIDASGQNVILEGGGSVQFFSISSGMALTLKNMTLQNGAASSGGAISMRSGGTLVIEDSRFLNNTAANFGGAIYIDTPPPDNPITPAYVTIIRTIFEDNRAGTEGGAIRVDGADGLQTSLAFLEISESTFRNNQTNLTNSASLGGAIRANYHVTLNIVGTLFDGNQSGGSGGALYTLYNQLPPYNQVNIANSTFSSNSSGHAYPLLVGGTQVSGGAANLDYSNLTHNTFVGNYFAGGDPTRNRGSAVYWPNGTVVARDNIFSNNTNGASECVRSGTAYTNNLTTDGTCNFPVGGNGATILDAVLQNNGGINETHALLLGSNAIDNSSSCTYVSSGTNNLFANGQAMVRDQRNMARPYNSICDIGAFEFRSPNQQCSIAEGNTYTFGSVQIEVPVSGAGNISCLTVEEAGRDHTAAPGPASNGNWWHISATDNFGDSAINFNVNLTLPHDSLSSPRLCRFPGSSGGYGWDCFTPESSNSSSATLNGVEAFSDWTVGDNVGPTAIELIDFSIRDDSKSNLESKVLITGVLSLVGLLIFQKTQDRRKKIV